MKPEIVAQIKTLAEEATRTLEVSEEALLAFLINVSLLHKVTDKSSLCEKQLLELITATLKRLEEMKKLELQRGTNQQIEA